MQKVVLPKRESKTITLPETGITLEIYPSLLVGELSGIDLKGESVDNSIRIALRLIKSWNNFASEEAEEPLEINLENIGMLPVEDINFLMEQIKEFAETQKKT